METSLRCNHLQCRAKLTEQAVVTTCSHIFCLECSSALGLSTSSGSRRSCPACRAPLKNPDDAVATRLNPSEDYKTSVLSGLGPTIIVECAGRALAFYAYQATQEILYQEYLAKGLSERHSVLSSQMDQVVHDANSEILNLRNKLSALQLDFDALRDKHQNLTDAYGEKSRAHNKTQRMYDGLKKQMLQLDVRSAAADAVAQQFGGHPRPIARSPDAVPTAHPNALRYRPRSGSSDHGDPSDNAPRYPTRAVFAQNSRHIDGTSPHISPQNTIRAQLPFNKEASAGHSFGPRNQHPAPFPLNSTPRLRQWQSSATQP